MFRVALLLIVLIQLLGCKSGENESEEEINTFVEKPLDLIPFDTMTHLYMHIHIIDGLVSSQNLNHNSSAELYGAYEEKMFQKIGVSKERFEKSALYYSSKPDEMNSIYEAVVDSLSLLEVQKKPLKEICP